MEQRKSLEQLKKFIEEDYNSVDNQNFHKLQSLISSVIKFEENFLKSYHKRKEEGVYYTNELISSFIAHESLIILINNKLSEISSNSLKVHRINDIFQLDIEMQRKINNMLLNLSICDPACGSGIFILSIVDIIFKLLRKLNQNSNMNEVKKILLRNLHGFDINADAINLSILKLLGWIYDGNGNEIPQIVSQLKYNFRRINSLTHPNLNKFDIIIGNPPYGNILNRIEKDLLKKEGIFYNDIYCSFLLKALNWSNEIIGFLVPKSFLLRQSYIEFRSQFLSKANILKIFDIGSKLFKNATNEVQIIFFENKIKAKSQDLEIFNFPDLKINTYSNQAVDALKICYNEKCSFCIKSKKLYAYTFKANCPYCGAKTVKLNRIRIKPNPLALQIISKIERNGDLNYLNPIIFPKMIRGEEDKGLSIVKNRLTNTPQKSCYFLNARNDFKYYFIKKVRSFNIEETNPRFLKGNNFEYYLSPKLLIKHNNIIPEAVYSEENVCFTSSIYSLLHDDSVELKYLCAILNSLLIQFYCIYGINNQKNTTINLNQYMIRHLPIQNPDYKTKVSIAKDVDEIISLFNKKNG
ncbi:MAG: Eco57I restriction-modification methylase domain-containing protein, partial [Promethearchaeota archaeon]